MRLLVYKNAADKTVHVTGHRPIRHIAHRPRPPRNKFFLSATVAVTVGDDITVTIYGMSSEGYEIARRTAIAGATVYIIDEANSSALTLNTEIARTYPTVLALKEDEPLMPIALLNNAISSADYLFFAPCIRTQSHNIKSDLQSNFKVAIGPLKSGASVVFCAPVGVGDNSDNVGIMEHVTGLGVGKQVHYYYYPLEDGYPSPFVIGSLEAKRDERLSDLLSTNPKKPIRFVNLLSSEYLHTADILSRFSGVYSMLELGKFVRDDDVRAEMALDERIHNLYLDDMVNGLLDMHLLEYSVDGTKSLLRLAVMYSRALEFYTKTLADNIKQIMRMYELRSSAIRVIVLWSFDPNLMRSDKDEVCKLLIERMRDYVNEVEASGNLGRLLSGGGKTTVIIPCSLKDFESASKVTRGKSNLLIVKANPLCERHP